MGLGGISIWQLLIILMIVVMIFGTKRLRNLGGDLGGALKGFKSAMKEDEAEKDDDGDGDGDDSDEAGDIVEKSIAEEEENK